MRMLLSISEEMDEALEAERRQRKLRYKQEAIREILGTDPLALSEDKRVTTLDKAGINKDPYGCVKSALSVESKQ
jgi:hypothetical protein